jgi:hypothetical protein
MMLRYQGSGDLNLRVGRPAVLVLGRVGSGRVGSARKRRPTDRPTDRAVHPNSKLNYQGRGNEN